MKLYMMVGPAGAGKSYFAKRHLMEGTGWRYISRDEVRFSIVSEDEDYFSKEDEVFEAYIKAIKSAFNEDGVFNVIADATHLSWASRRKLLISLGDLVKKIDVIPVVIQVDEATNIRQNEQRTGRSMVPRSVIKSMRKGMSDPAGDRFKYTAIVYVNNSNGQYSDKPKVLYHKSDIKVKDYSLKSALNTRRQE